MEQPERAPWGRIAIGARLSRIDPAFFSSWSALLLGGLRAGDVVLDPAVELPHACACNFLAAQFLSMTECDALLFLDDDMVFTPHDFTRLRESAQDCDVVSALACCRRYPNFPVVLTGFDEQTKRPVKTLELGGVVRVQFVGLAFTLVRRWVLEKLAERGHPFPAFDVELGEDGLFSRSAVEIGARLAVNSDVGVGHVVKHTARWSVGDKRPLFEAQQFGLR